MAHVLNISEAASLAIHGMMLVAEAGEKRISAKAIAEELTVSEAHLAKVLQRLSRSGLVEGTRGPKGGFVLGRPADQITLLEVYETIEGPLSDMHCLFRESQCRLGTCVFGNLMAEATELVRSYLEPTTLADLVPLRRPTKAIVTKDGAADSAD